MNEYAHEERVSRECYRFGHLISIYQPYGLNDRASATIDVQPNFSTLIPTSSSNTNFHERSQSQWTTLTLLRHVVEALRVADGEWKWLTWFGSIHAVYYPMKYTLNIRLRWCSTQYIGYQLSAPSVLRTEYPLEKRRAVAVRCINRIFACVCECFLFVPN